MSFAESLNEVGFATTDATFRAFWQKFHDLLLAAGLTQTSDTGQIDLTTVTLPALNGYGGYEIWRFNDADAGTYGDVYIKFEYGQGSTANGRFQLRFTLGTGSDGAGNLTNPSTSQVNSTSATPSNTNKAYIGVSFFDGCLGILMHGDTVASSASSMQKHLLIERLRSPVDGSVIAGAIKGALDTAGNGALRVGGVWTSSSGVEASTPSVVGSNLAVLGTMRTYQTPAAPHRSILLGPSTIAASDSGNVTIGGANKTYKCPGSTSIAWQGRSEKVLIRSA